MTTDSHQDRADYSEILLWPRDTDTICERVRSKKSSFKVIMKTRNEEILLKPWLDHYRKFLSPSEIIIADNMSTSKSVLDIYKDIEEDTLVFQYESTKDGLHNYVHNRTNFRDLYEALEDSCDHFIFVDNDEFLILCDRQKWSADRTDFLHTLKGFKGKALTSVWLEPIPRSLDICSIGTDKRKLVSGMTWGKPLLPSNFTEPGILIHNAQFPKELFAVSERVFVLLHLTNFSPEQRLSVNRQKLINRGFAEPEDSYEDIAARDTSGTSDFTVVRLVGEMRTILQQGQAIERPALAHDRVRFADGGAVVFGSADVEALFLEMFDKQADYLDEAFQSAETTLQADKVETPPTVTIKNVAMNQRALRARMASYPDELDEDGDPLYRKELIRLLLAQGKWQQAYGAIPRAGGPGQDGWHHRLFARAYDQDGQLSKAIEHWKAFIATRPSHQEAILALQAMERRAFPLELSEEECDLFQQTIKGKANYLEFGAGGSTLLAARSGVTRIISVASDPKLLQRLAERPEIKTIGFTPVHVDIGPTDKLGFPLEREKEAEWPYYYVRPWDHVSPDVVLIHGRFRVACALACIFHCGPSARIMIHDFWTDNRYEAVLKYMDCIDRAGTLGVFVKKPELDFSTFEQDLALYARNPR